MKENVVKTWACTMVARLDEKNLKDSLWACTMVEKAYLLLALHII
jgi:hypothetical protein